MIAVLALSMLTVGGSSGASSPTKSERHADTTICTNAIDAHAKLTRSDVSACMSSSYHVSKCPSWSKVAFVKFGNVVEAIQSRHRSHSLGVSPGLAALGRACGTHTEIAATTTTTTTASTTTTTTTQPPPPTTAPPTTSSPPPPPTTVAPAGCYPIDDEGGCYEPGEYCRDDDHGTSGVAGDGKPITCEDNDGWRWEPT
jgi:hypothetical protein